MLRLLVKLADATADWATEVARIPHSISRLARIATLYHAGHTASGHVIATDELEANRLDIKCLVLALLTSVLLEESTARLSVFQSSSSAFPVVVRSLVDAEQE